MASCLKLAWSSSVHMLSALALAFAAFVYSLIILDHFRSRTSTLLTRGQQVPGTVGLWEAHWR